MEKSIQTFWVKEYHDANKGAVVWQYPLKNIRPILLSEVAEKYPSRGQNPTLADGITVRYKSKVDGCFKLVTVNKCWSTKGTRYIRSQYIILPTDGEIKGMKECGIEPFAYIGDLDGEPIQTTVPAYQETQVVLVATEKPAETTPEVTNPDGDNFVYLARMVHITSGTPMHSDKKLGRASDIKRRGKELNRVHTKDPFRVQIYRAWYTNGSTVRLEKALHAFMSNAHSYGEWFKDADNDLEERLASFMKAMDFKEFTLINEIV